MESGVGKGGAEEGVADYKTMKRGIEVFVAH